MTRILFSFSGRVSCRNQALRVQAWKTLQDKRIFNQGRVYNFSKGSRYRNLPVNFLLTWRRTASRDFISVSLFTWNFFKRLYFNSWKDQTINISKRKDQVTRKFLAKEMDPFERNIKIRAIRRFNVFKSLLFAQHMQRRHVLRKFRFQC